MGKAVVHTVQVEFGDCDPARIVWFPNVFRWIDAASRNFFVHCGVPAWHALEKSHGIIGTPLVDTQARFVNTASYGDTLDIHTRIAEWRAKSFVQHYRVVRADTLVMECTEVRIFATRRAGSETGSETGIRAVAVPADLRALCD